jgi:hypothetical protein
METRPQLVFDRDAWHPEHYDEIAECLESRIMDHAAIAKLIKRDGTTAGEVGCAIRAAKAAHWHANHKPTPSELAMCCRVESRRRREAGRQPIASYPVETPPNLRGNFVEAITEALENSTVASDDDRITLKIIGEECQEEIDLAKPVYLYLFEFFAGELLSLRLAWAKIGISNNPERRRIVFATGVPAKVMNKAQIEIPHPFDPYRIETLVHGLYPDRLERELFKYADADELRKAYNAACAQYYAG